MFQDGLIAQAITEAKSAGVTYVTAAGNLEDHAVYSDYYDIIPSTDDDEYPTTGNDFHRFDDGSPYAEVTVPDGCGFTAVLQWAEPFDGVLGSGATSDYDLYRCYSKDPSMCFPMDGSAQGCSSVYGGGGDPIEVGHFTNDSGADKTIYLAVDQYCGTDRPIRLVVIEDCSGEIVYSSDFRDTPIYGHATSADAITVAASFYAEIDSDGALQGDPTLVDTEAFSSRGGDIAIYFSADGSAVGSEPDERFKPDVAGPDGANTSFFGIDSAADEDVLPNFFGTSAAAAHVAAVAALLIEHEPTMSPALVADRIRTTTWDIATPYLDRYSGRGLVDALNVISGQQLPVEVSRIDAVAADGTIVVTWTTAVEDRVIGFDVQHSRDDEDYVTEQYVAARGSGSTYQATLPGAAPGSHFVRLRTVESSGMVDYSQTVEVSINVQGSYILSEVYPNPFNPSATFGLTVASGQHVTIDVFDVTGRTVARLYDGLIDANTPQRFTLDGSGLSSGLYYVRATGEAFAASTTAVLLK
jgi:hypothetical protein